jgi:hypothetical protein
VLEASYFPRHWALVQGGINLLNCIYTPMVLSHLSPIHFLLCSLALLHPASIGRKAASRVITAPSPPTSPAHKSLARRPCFSTSSRSKVTTLDLLLHWIIYSFVFSCSLLLHLHPSYSILLDLQMKMYLLVLEFVTLYIHGVQLVSLIFLNIVHQICAL